MTLEGTDGLVAPSGVAGYDFQRRGGGRQPAAAQLLNEQGVKAIVVMLHEGGLQTGAYSACIGISGPIVDIAKSLDPSIDAIVTGHTHAAVQLHDQRPEGSAAQGHERHVRSAGSSPR